MTKFDKAYKIFLIDPTASRKQFIQTFVEELGMSSAAASTYHYNCKKKYSESAPAVIAPAVIAPVKVVDQEPKAVATKYVVRTPDCVPAFLIKNDGK